MKTFLNLMCAAALISMICFICACGGKSVNKTDSNIEKVHAEILDLVQAGRDMEPLRASSNGCEEKMDELNKEAMRIAEEISKMSEHVALRLAVIEIYNCISCSSDALAACDETKKILSEPEKYAY